MVIVLVYVMELVLRNNKISNILLITMIFGIVGVIIFIYLPVMGFGNSEDILGVFQGRLLDYQNMHTRYSAWNEVLELAKQQGIEGQILGNSLSVGVGGNIYVESLYIKTYYAMGLVGLLLALILLIAVVRHIVMVKDRKTFYLMVIMAVMLLGTGVAINSMERVQMSWFPMMFAGMVVSSVREEKIEDI